MSRSWHGRLRGGASIAPGFGSASNEHAPISIATCTSTLCAVVARIDGGLKMGVPSPFPCPAANPVPTPADEDVAGSWRLHDRQTVWRIASKVRTDVGFLSRVAVV